MSSILKALRKVEDEKAALGEGGVDLAHDILKRNYDEPRKAPWLLIASSGLLLLFVAVGAGLWLQRMPPAKPVVVVTPPAVKVPVEPVVTEPQLVVSKPSTVTAPDEKIPAAIVSIEEQPENTDSAAPIAVKEPVEQPAFAIPDLSIDEIIYHQDPASRLVVINDLPVMVGTDIEGVRVEEILPDRVLFSYRGRHFEKRLKSE